MNHGLINLGSNGLTINSLINHSFNHYIANLPIDFSALIIAKKASVSIGRIPKYLTKDLKLQPLLAMGTTGSTMGTVKGSARRAFELFIARRFGEARPLLAEAKGPGRPAAVAV